MKRRLTLVLAMLLCASMLFGCSVARHSADADTAKQQEQDLREESTDNIDTEEKSDSEQDDQKNDQKSASEDKKESDSKSESQSESNKDKKSSSDNEMGTKENPVPMGRKFTWSGIYDTYYNYEYTFSLTVNDAKPITREELEEMDLQVYEDVRFEYRILDIKVTADIKLLDCEEGDVYLSAIFPSFVGSKSIEGDFIIGYCDYGFEGSFRKRLSDEVEFTKIKIGESGSYSVDGKIIIPVYKGKTNYLIVRNDTTKEDIYLCIE